MADLIDLSLLIIALAVAGFIFKEVFYFYRKFCTPYDDNNLSDNTFGYVSIAVLIIGTCWILLLLPGVSDPEIINNFLKPLTQGLQKLIDLGLISDTEMMSYVAKTVLLIFVFTWLSVMFVSALFVTLILGILSIYIDKKAVQIEFLTSDKSPKKFKRIIKESDCFLYVETLENFRRWEAVRKSEISSIKNITTKSKIERKILQNMPDFIQKHPIIVDERKRLFIAVFCLLLALGFAILAGVSPFGLTKILLIIFCVPALFLVIIDAALSEDEE